MAETPATPARAELRRRRLIATGVLILLLALYALTSMLRARWPWLAYPRAFAEAGVVGGCADWFAVVALFRHPLGIRIPHTAIIPRQKQRIGEALGRFISNNFLAPAEVTARIERLDAAGWLAAWLKDPAHLVQVSSRSQGLLPPLLDLIGEGQVRDFSRRVIVQGVDSIALAPLLGRTLSVLMGQGHYDTAFNLTVDMARAFLERHRDRILQRVAKTNSSWVPGWLDVRFAEAIFTELLAALALARAGDHPWRTQGRTAVNSLIVRLAQDPVLFDQCERLKSGILSKQVVDGYLEWLGGEVEARLRQELTEQNSLMTGGLERALLAAGRWLEGDAHVRSLLNDWSQRIVLNTVVAGRDEIGAFVAGVVERWDTDALVDRLELQVGPDLQTIRLNGALVGGLVGLVLFTLSQAKWPA